jgi:N-acetylneuraminate epimerase
MPGTSADSSAREHIEWSRGPDLPLPRGGYFAAWHAGGLVLAGGTYWAGGVKRWSDATSFFDPSRHSWTEWTPLPRPMGYGAFSSYAGALYLMAGCDAERRYRDVYRLDSPDGEWQRVGECPEDVTYTAAASAGDSIYVLGGAPDTTNLAAATDHAWAFTPASRAWRALPAIPGGGRAVHVAAAVGKDVYVFGGCRQEAAGLTDLDSVCRFDTAAGTWEQRRRAPVAGRAWGAAVAPDAVYLVGGYGGAFLDTVYRYALGADSWELVSHLPQPLADAKFFYGDGALYGAGGEDGPGSRFGGTLIGRLQ